MVSITQQCIEALLQRAQTNSETNTSVESINQDPSSSDSSPLSEEIGTLLQSISTSSLADEDYPQYAELDCRFILSLVRACESLCIDINLDAIESFIKSVTIVGDCLSSDQDQQGELKKPLFQSCPMLSLLLEREEEVNSTNTQHGLFENKNPMDMCVPSQLITYLQNKVPATSSSSSILSPPSQKRRRLDRNNRSDKEQDNAVHPSIWSPIATYFLGRFMLIMLTKGSSNSKWNDSKKNNWNKLCEIMRQSSIEFHDAVSSDDILNMTDVRVRASLTCCALDLLADGAASFTETENDCFILSPNVLCDNMVQDAVMNFLANSLAHSMTTTTNYNTIRMKLISSASTCLIQCHDHHSFGTKRSAASKFAKQLFDYGMKTERMEGYLRRESQLYNTSSKSTSSTHDDASLLPLHTWFYYPAIVSIKTDLLGSNISRAIDTVKLLEKYCRPVNQDDIHPAEIGWDTIFRYLRATNLLKRCCSQLNMTHLGNTLFIEFMTDLASTAIENIVRSDHNDGPSVEDIILELRQVCVAFYVARTDAATAIRKAEEAVQNALQDQDYEVEKIEVKKGVSAESQALQLYLRPSKLVRSYRVDKQKVDDTNISVSSSESIPVIKHVTVMRVQPHLDTVEPNESAIMALNRKRQRTPEVETNDIVLDEKFNSSTAEKALEATQAVLRNINDSFVLRHRQNTIATTTEKDIHEKNDSNSSEPIYAPPQPAAVDVEMVCAETSDNDDKKSDEASSARNDEMDEESIYDEQAYEDEEVGSEEEQWNEEESYEEHGEQEEIAGYTNEDGVEVLEIPDTDEEEEDKEDIREKEYHSSEESHTSSEKYDEQEDENEISHGSDDNESGRDYSSHSEDGDSGEYDSQEEVSPEKIHHSSDDEAEDYVHRQDAEEYSTSESEDEDSAHHADSADESEDDGREDVSHSNEQVSIRYDGEKEKSVVLESESENEHETTEKEVITDENTLRKADAEDFDNTSGKKETDDEKAEENEANAHESPSDAVYSSDSEDPDRVSQVRKNIISQTPIETEPVTPKKDLTARESIEQVEDVEKGDESHESPPVSKAGDIPAERENLSKESDPIPTNDYQRTTEINTVDSNDLIESTKNKNSDNDTHSEHNAIDPGQVDANDAEAEKERNEAIKSLRSASTSDATQILLHVEEETAYEADVSSREKHQKPTILKAPAHKSILKRNLEEEKAYEADVEIEEKIKGLPSPRIYKNMLDDDSKESSSVTWANSVHRYMSPSAGSRYLASKRQSVPSQSAVSVVDEAAYEADADTIEPNRRHSDESTVSKDHPKVHHLKNTSLEKEEKAYEADAEMDIKDPSIYSDGADNINDRKKMISNEPSEEKAYEADAEMDCKDTSMYSDGAEETTKNASNFSDAAENIDESGDNEGSVSKEKDSVVELKTNEPLEEKVYEADAEMDCKDTSMYSDGVDNLDESKDLPKTEEKAKDADVEMECMEEDIVIDVDDHQESITNDDEMKQEEKAYEADAEMDVKEIPKTDYEVDVEMEIDISNENNTVDDENEENEAMASNDGMESNPTSSPGKTNDEDAEMEIDKPNDDNVVDDVMEEKELATSNDEIFESVVDLSEEKSDVDETGINEKDQSELADRSEEKSEVDEIEIDEKDQAELTNANEEINPNDEIEKTNIQMGVMDESNDNNEIENSNEKELTTSTDDAVESNATSPIKTNDEVAELEVDKPNDDNVVDDFIEEKELVESTTHLSEEKSDVDETRMDERELVEAAANPSERKSDVDETEIEKYHLKSVDIFAEIDEDEIESGEANISDAHKDDDIEDIEKDEGSDTKSEKEITETAVEESKNESQGEESIIEEKSEDVVESSNDEMKVKSDEGDKNAENDDESQSDNKDILKHDDEAENVDIKELSTAQDDIEEPKSELNKDEPNQQSNDLSGGDDINDGEAELDDTADPQEESAPISEENEMEDVSADERSTDSSKEKIQSAERFALKQSAEALTEEEKMSALQEKSSEPPLKELSSRRIRGRPPLPTRSSNKAGLPPTVPRASQKRKATATIPASPTSSTGSRRRSARSKAKETIEDVPSETTSPAPSVGSSRRSTRAKAEETIEDAPSETTSPAPSVGSRRRSARSKAKETIEDSAPSTRRSTRAKAKETIEDVPSEPTSPAPSVGSRRRSARAKAKETIEDVPSEPTSPAPSVGSRRRSARSKVKETIEVSASSTRRSTRAKAKETIEDVPTETTSPAPSVGSRRHNTRSKGRKTIEDVPFEPTSPTPSRQGKKRGSKRKLATDATPDKSEGSHRYSTRARDKVEKTKPTVDDDDASLSSTINTEHENRYTISPAKRARSKASPKKNFHIENIAFSEENENKVERLEDDETISLPDSKPISESEAKKKKTEKKTKKKVTSPPPKANRSTRSSTRQTRSKK